jgi:hypothetical protein
MAQVEALKPNEHWELERGEDIDLVAQALADESGNGSQRRYGVSGTDTVKLYKPEGCVLFIQARSCGVRPKTCRNRNDVARHTQHGSLIPNIFAGGDQELLGRDSTD